MIKKIHGLSCLVINILLIGGSILYLQKQQISYYSKQNDSDLNRQEANLLSQINLQRKIPSFGYDNILGNWLYLQFVQYFGDGEVRDKVGYFLIPEYFAAIADRDPYFIEAYLSLSSANSIYAAQPEKTVEFLDQVLTHIEPEKFPYASYLWTYKAVDELLFLGDVKAAEHSYRMAAEWAKKRGDEEGKLIAERNLETADFLATNPDSKLVRISGWSFILNNAHDDKTRRYVLEQLKALGAEIVVNPQGELEIRLPEKDYEASPKTIS